MIQIVTDQLTWDRWNDTGEWVLFRESESKRCAGCDISPRVHSHVGVPPAKFVEAAKPCETCGGFGLLKAGSVHPKCWGGQPAPCATICPDCLDGKRRVAVVVPCPTCSIEQDGRIKPGLELCTRCVPRHWELCSTCTVWSDDEFTITSGFVTVGHVVVEWGPLVAKDAGDATCTPGNPHLVIYSSGAAEWCNGHNTHRLLTLPPYVDPATLIGQYGLGGKVVRLGFS